MAQKPSNSRSQPALKIALIGFPILNLRPNPGALELARYVIGDKGWHIALAGDVHADAIRMAEKMGCDGALVRLISPQMCRVARSSSMPMVNVSGWIKSPGVPTVRRGDASIGRLAAQHLYEKNYKRLASVQMPWGDFHAARCLGFHDRSRELRLPYENFHFKNAPDEKEKNRFFDWVRDLQKPVGLFLSDDTVAPLLLYVPELLGAIQQRGLSIPRDLGVVCGSIHPDRIDLCAPSLTYIECDEGAINRRAVDRLDEMMRRKLPDGPLVESIDCTTVRQRDSTRFAASEDPLVAQAIEYIDTHVHEGIDVNSISGALEVSVATLISHFKTEQGTTPYVYLTGVRIEMAQRMLSTTRASIQSVATACGFRDRKRMNIVFAKHRALTPSQWRLRHKV